jgi:hypothetical protein
MTDNFVARRQAALQAELEQRAEWKAEDEMEHALCELQCEFEAQMERDRVQRRKYWEAMIAKKNSSLALLLTDEQLLERFDERQQYDDGGEPTPDDWECWLAEGNAAFRSLAQIETEQDDEPSAPQSQGEVTWIRI